MSRECKNIVITGANRGIGLELVKQILTRFQPENLFATYRDPANSEELLELSEVNRNLHCIQFDVRATENYSEFVAKIGSVTQGSGVNLLINNAGVVKGDKSLLDLGKDVLLYHLEINTVAPILLTKAFLPLLEKASSAGKMNGVPIGSIGRAVVVQMSSVLGSIGENKMGANYGYRISKSALNQAAKTMSIDPNLKEMGISVIAMHPGWVRTDMGGPNAHIGTTESISGMLEVLENLTENDNGHFKRFDGKECLW